MPCHHRVGLCCNGHQLKDRLVPLHAHRGHHGHHLPPWREVKSPHGPLDQSSGSATMSKVEAALFTSTGLRKLLRYWARSCAIHDVQTGHECLHASLTN